MTNADLTSGGDGPRPEGETRTAPGKDASADVSEKVLLKEIALREARIRLVWRPFFTLLGLAAVMAAMTLPADVLSGKETIVNLELAITVTVSVSLAGFGTWIWGNRHRRRADRLDMRNKDLTRDVKELQQRLRDNHLSDRVSR